MGTPQIPSNIFQISYRKEHKNSNWRISSFTFCLPYSNLFGSQMDWTEMGMETLIGIPIGVGLSAACGFRVFVPLLVMNLAVLTGHLHLSPGFEWIGSDYATVAFVTATLVEVLAYYIPWLDHVLDLIASPAAIIAGMGVTASVFMDISPFLKWTLAIIAGGGTAA